MTDSKNADQEWLDKMVEGVGGAVPALAMMALAEHKDGKLVEAARDFERAASMARREARTQSMAGTVQEDALHRLIRYCGQCGRGIVVLGDRHFRIDRRYCSDSCKQAAHRKRHPKPAKLPKVIALGAPGSS